MQQREAGVEKVVFWGGSAPSPTVPTEGEGAGGEIYGVGTHGVRARLRCGESERFRKLGA